MGTVLIGKKPRLNYVLAVITQLQAGEKVEVKARGRLISKAVDVVEMVRKRFLPDVKLEKIEIGTEKMVNQQGKETNVSTITIVLSK